MVREEGEQMKAKARQNEADDCAEIARLKAKAKAMQEEQRQVNEHLQVCPNCCALKFDLLEYVCLLVSTQCRRPRRYIYLTPEGESEGEKEPNIKKRQPKTDPKRGTPSAQGRLAGLLGALRRLLSIEFYF